ncbi:MAG: polymer-forming cytoskeletal family protein [Candidatus Abyssobacteria bacterium SURF_17]|uniref:Polymer-forming cytoskeletal family protein n=1 Tax=Candidatus Abyssobacteria bacterium SURF_17 TaxID=2093361 RepID=A0A419EW46_9BACT|nr:MAG: polymer-forming cytoskeletal family protein [Candidatus Abyssubacteria bacterium SURF_17]
MMGFFGKKNDESIIEEKPVFKSRGPQEMVDTSKVDTVVGPGSTLKGDIHSRGTLRIDGNVEGNVRADAAVIVGEKGVVKASVIANHIIIGGTVHGNVNGREKVEILSTGRMYGDVTTAAAKFVVAEGVIFEGRCTMSQTDAAKAKFPKVERHAEEQELAAASRGGAA